MRAFTKATLIFSLSGALVLSLAGCSTGDDSTKTVDKPTATATSPESATPAPTTTTVPSGSSDATAEVDGDLTLAVDANGTPITVTDSYGSYQKVTINSEARALQVDPATVDASVAALGWSDEDLASAQRWVATFVAEQGIDSIAVDGTTGWDAWKATEASKYVAPQWLDMVNNAADEADVDRSPFVVNNLNNNYPDLVRDGTARISSANIDIFSVYAVDAVNIGFDGKAVVSYEATDASMLASAMRSNPSYTEAEILEKYPHFTDGVSGTFTATFRFTYAVERDGNGGYRLTGFQNHVSAEF